MGSKITAQAIDAVLPQTQCRECGYNGCLPYAEALAAGSASLDRCPPGGVKVLRALGDLLSVDVSKDIDNVLRLARAPSVAVIREQECIGCTKCIQACPVDAIFGAAKQLHHVIPQECTGCGLCVEPCPVDCIEMQSLEEPMYQPDIARRRFQDRNVRLLRDEQEKHQAYREKRRLARQQDDVLQEKKAKQQYILEALDRVKQKSHR